ncbi:hypothetical protein NDA17_005483 [Ustilago hordei]|nr:hypothetical protein NDA17_005483 [Ustilago hordei]
MGYGPAGVQDSGAGPTPRRPPEAARAGDLTMRRPTLHGNEFVSAERILRAALEDGPIGFMLLEEPPSSLPAFGFVPTGADKGVEMEVEVDKVVTAADIPKPYQHLRDVFDEVEADKLPHHTEHDLHLELIEGGSHLKGPLYLKGPKEMSELRRYLDENLEKGFIRPSKSPARSPVLFVPKKDGGLRLCVDYRGLNEITVKNRAPLPLIEEQLFLLRKARIYTKLDLRAAYNLIWIAKGDEWKTAFGTQLGLYEYLVMPFGLANAPAHFQSFINDIFQDIIGVYVLGTININVMMTPRSGVSVDDDEVDGVGDEIGDVDDNEVDGVGDKVGGVNTSVQCVDLMLEVIPRLQWTTAFGSILIQTANLLWVPSDIR